MLCTVGDRQGAGPGLNRPASPAGGSKRCKNTLNIAITTFWCWQDQQSDVQAAHKRWHMHVASACRCRYACAYLRMYARKSCTFSCSFEDHSNHAASPLFECRQNLGDLQSLVGAARAGALVVLPFSPRASCSTSNRSVLKYRTVFVGASLMFDASSTHLHATS